MDLILIYFSIKYKNHFHSIFEALRKKEAPEMEKLNKLQQKIDNGEIKAITIIDDDYPELLKEIHNPPFVIFYRCKTNKLNREETIKLINDNICKIGIRNSSELELFFEDLIPGVYSKVSNQLIH